VLLSRSDNVLALARELGGVAMVGDVTDPGDLESLVHLALETNGRIDAVVSSTGLSRDRHHFDGRRFDAGKDGELLDIPDADWLAMFEVFYLASVRLARLVTPVMQRQGKGAIVNISAMAAREPYDCYPTSSTIRRALDGFAKLYADRYARDGIRMNNLGPGAVDTIPWSEDARRAVPAQRIAAPEEIAAVAAFLLSDDASYITGQNIIADGGLNRSI